MLKAKFHSLVQVTINCFGRKEDIYEMNGQKINSDKLQHEFINLEQINKRLFHSPSSNSEILRYANT
jgi:hypothetical protein